MLHGSLPWVRRGASAALLLAVGFTPAEASTTPPRPCSGGCTLAGSTRWVRPLDGPYVVQDDSRGTVPAQGEPYAAIGTDVAVLGLGGTVQAFDARTGAPRWTSQLSDSARGVRAVPETAPPQRASSRRTPTAGASAAGTPRAGTRAAAPAATPTAGGRATGAPNADARQRQPRGTSAATPPDGPQIVSVRTWPGVVTVGVRAPARASGAARRGSGPGQPAASRSQIEVVLDAATGREIGAYPRAAFGGAVAADRTHTVVIQQNAVTSYRNARRSAAWTVPTGPAPQAWKLDGDDLYITAGSGGNPAGITQHPASELRRIDLRTGAERTIRSRHGPFAGSLGAALDGVVLFTNADGVTAYSGTSGERLWARGRQDLPQGVDVVQRRFYLSEWGGLAAVDPWTGQAEAWLHGSDGLYAERDGVAFGMDEGAEGSAWGVATTSQRVVWTVNSLPWPHYFVDFSGLGGSADPRSDAAIVAACGQVNPGTSASASTQPCAKPELVVINR